MRSITAVTDQASLLSARVNGKIDGVAYRVKTLTASVEKARSSLLTATIQPHLTRLTASIADLRTTLGTTGKTLVLHVVRAPTTLAGIAVDAHAPVTELIKLNRDLVRSPVVNAGTVVRYYKKAA
jgi:LysM repeat protein